jgi:hypothetical protein
MEVYTRETFLVDLSIHVVDPGSYTIDEDDPNQALVWTLEFDETHIALLGTDGLIYQIQALDVPGMTTLNFTVTDPSGASDSIALELAILRKDSQDDGGGFGWLLWVVLVVLVAVALLAVATTRRRPEPRAEELELAEPGREWGPPPGETQESARLLSEALASKVDAGTEAEDEGFPGDLEGFEEKDDVLASELDELLDDVDSFVEVEGRATGEDHVEDEGMGTTIPPVPGGTRVVDGTDGRARRTFRLEGVAVLGADGRRLASTGKVQEVVGPYQDGLGMVLGTLGDDGSAYMEVKGRRVLIVTLGKATVLCVIRGKVDLEFRDLLDNKLRDLDLYEGEDAALALIDDLLSGAGKPDRAEVVKDAWTTRLSADVSNKGSIVVLTATLHNDTDHILNNVRLDVEHDHDALTIETVRPKMLVTQGRMSMGNVPPRTEQEVTIDLVPALCLSSVIKLLATYTDREGNTVHVPARALAVNVECPYIVPGTEMGQETLLSLSEEGLGFTGRRVFVHGLDVDRLDLFKLAVTVVATQGPMKVLELDDESLMRAEAWFLGSGEGGAPRVLVRVSSHGTDHLVELFITSDDGPTATGLLTYLAGEFIDTAASEFPGKRIERVRDVATLEDVEAWPSLLDYKIMGE